MVGISETSMQSFNLHFLHIVRKQQVFSLFIHVLISIKIFKKNLATSFEAVLRSFNEVNKRPHLLRASLHPAKIKVTPPTKNKHRKQKTIE